jgi:hypothetical protein
MTWAPWPSQRKNVPVFSPCNADPTVPNQFSVYNPVGVGGNRQVAALATYMKSKVVASAGEEIRLRCATAEFEHAEEN